MSKEGFAFIYKRHLIVEENTRTTYQYFSSFLEKGKEVKKFEKKEFISDKGISFPFIEDADNKTEQFVYAFPFYSDLKNDELDNLILNVERIKKDDDNTHLYQIDTQERTLTTIAINDEEKQIDPSNFDNYLKMIGYEKENEEETVNETIEKIIEENNSYKLLEENETIDKPKIIVKMNTADAYQYIRDSIIGQDEQIKQIVTILSKNLHLANIYLNTDSNEKNSLIDLKQSLFICGSTGVGKTAILKLIAKYADVPIIIADATRYTAPGYKGDDTENILKALIRSANFDLEKAKRGIIVIDEFDKKCKAHSKEDIITDNVQSTFLTMMKGNIFPIEMNKYGNVIDFDTSAVTFAFLGAYSGIEEYNKIKPKIGFDNIVNLKSFSEIYTEENLRKFGVLKELLGRGNVIALNDLNIEIMKKIIVESNQSPLILNQKLYELLGSKLTCPQESIDIIASKAMSYKSGARGIEKVFTNTLSKAEYEIYSNTLPSEIIITPESVENSKKLVLKY